MRGGTGTQNWALRTKRLAAVFPQRLETPSGTWALRQQPSTVPLTQSVHYPTIQDPTDPSKSVYPAIVVSCLLDKGLNAGPSPAAGVWDDEAQCWSQQGVEGVSYDPSTGRLEFTAHSLGCMALLQDRTAMVPYKAWSVRPIDGRGGRRAALTLYLEALERPVQFGIGEGRVWLLDSPTEVTRARLRMLHDSCLLTARGTHHAPCTALAVALAGYGRPRRQGDAALGPAAGDVRPGVLSPPGRQPGWVLGAWEGR